MRTESTLGNLKASLRQRPAMGRGRGGRVRSRRGGAVLETALVMGLLIMLSFGTAEYGYFFFVKNILAGAARDGVRAAIPATALNSDVTSAISSAMSAAHISSTNYTVTTSPADITTATSGTPVTVTITCTWGTVGVTPLPVAMGGIPNTKQVTGVAVMRKES
jgi:Flp pilus assembly protein TadG